MFACKWLTLQIKHKETNGKDVFVLVSLSHLSFINNSFVKKLHILKLVWLYGFAQWTHASIHVSAPVDIISVRMETLFFFFGCKFPKLKNLNGVLATPSQNFLSTASICHIFRKHRSTPVINFKHAIRKLTNRKLCASAKTACLVSKKIIRFSCHSILQFRETNLANAWKF